ncbi:MAG: S-adenosylmethionine:tRNA ribosyltransferase-isomerase, partial [Acidimicrobiia bacterium]
MQIEDFDYQLPADAIAQMPAEPRDAARLLVVGDPPVDTAFTNLPDYLTEGDLLVVNATRVRAARLQGTRPSGGAVELLLLDQTRDGWEALARPARKLRPGMLLSFDDLTAEVRRVEADGVVVVSLSTGSGAGVDETIDRVGSVPYPPYVTAGPSDPGRYQTVYAASTGSAAAPTAGLHFTRNMLEQLAARGIHTAEVFLDIGLDTFRPIASSNLDDHR